MTLALDYSSLAVKLVQAGVLGVFTHGRVFTLLNLGKQFVP